MASSDIRVIEVTSDQIESPGDVPGLIPGHPDTAGIHPMDRKLVVIRDHYREVNVNAVPININEQLAPIIAREEELAARYAAKMAKTGAKSITQPTPDVKKVVYNKPEPSPVSTPKVNVGAMFEEQIKRQADLADKNELEPWDD